MTNTMCTIPGMNFRAARGLAFTALLAAARVS
jgi:hypothetical protein